MKPYPVRILYDDDLDPEIEARICKWIHHALHGIMGKQRKAAMRYLAKNRNQKIVTNIESAPLRIDGAQSLICLLTSITSKEGDVVECIAFAGFKQKVEAMARQKLASFKSQAIAEGGEAYIVQEGELPL